MDGHEAEIWRTDGQLMEELIYIFVNQSGPFVTHYHVITLYGNPLLDLLNIFHKEVVHFLDSCRVSG